ncbi:MAG: hypothetical protein Q8O19_06635, partial [Rectinemataceae bacterium]|nr:hypothetical protein [Rectinemataceae bacterium]
FYKLFKTSPDCKKPDHDLNILHLSPGQQIVCSVSQTRRGKLIDLIFIVACGLCNYCLKK